MIPHGPSRLEVLQNQYAKLLSKVMNWRVIFSQWQLGTRDDVNGENRALQDHREEAMKTRIELAGLIELLIEKHMIRREDLLEEQIEVASRLNKSLEEKFPGAVATDDGMEIQPEAFQATKDRLGFPI
jgi:hypothetical protein